MRKFKEAYKQAVDSMPRYHISADCVTDELRHRRLLNRRRRKTAMQAAAAAVLFLACGAGTVTAMNYHKSIFRVTKNGFTAVSEGALVTEEDTLPAKEAGAEAEAAQNALTQEREEPQVLEAQTYVPVEYTSIEAFEEAEDISIAIPDQDWLGGTPLNERVLVMGEGDRVMLTVNYEECCFSMSQWDHRDVTGYASSTVFTGESDNEREYTNSQGLEYMLFDIMEEGMVSSTHAVISVNGRDLQLDFSGYDEETIEHILNNLDLSIYFKEE